MAKLHFIKVVKTQDLSLLNYVWQSKYVSLNASKNKLKKK